jgi:hypothetical protein
VLYKVLLICGASNQVRSLKDRQPSDEAQAFARIEMYEQISFFKGNKKEHIQKLDFLNELYKIETSKDKEDNK